ncbi:MAG: protein kinase [Kofleriaceae bacterium]|nr:protein kinase [Kofleriaceae bacterium]
MALVEHQRVMTSVDSIAKIDHPHLLPTLLSEEISDNHLIVSPLRSETLREVVARENLSPRARVELLIQAMRGMAALHNENFLHRDFTLRNILVDADLKTAYLFDFDLALDLKQVQDTNYKKRFKGRIFGSPGYSLVPEVLDEVLMTGPIGASLDIYAMGTAIFSLFTEDLPYGEAVDLWSLLLRVSKGIVRGGRSYIDYPISVPRELRPVIETCMQRVPTMRYKSAEEVIAALEKALPGLDAGRSNNSIISTTMSYGDGDSRFLFGRMVTSKVNAELPLATATAEILKEHGYVLRRSLGKIKDREIFAAAPDPQLVALGHFPDGNPYPKIVSVLNLRDHENPKALADKWLTVYQPALEKARQGLMTSLHRVLYDEPSSLLLLLSEYVEDARFGKDLTDEVLELQEAFGLTYLITEQIALLHENGLAHNNVCAESLLLKGIRDSHCVHPAMVGIVHPSEDPLHMHEDSQNLVSLLLSWIRDAEVESINPLERSKIEVLRDDLKELESGPASSCDLPHVMQICKDALATLDFNFGVLNEHGGDLHAYALTLVSHSLYARLWH